MWLSGCLWAYLLVLPANLAIKQITSEKFVPVGDTGQMQKKWSGIGGVTHIRLEFHFVNTLSGSTML